MSTIGDKLNTFKDAFAAAYPLRIVTRSYVQIEERSEADLKKGVWQILSKGVTGIESPVQIALLEGDLSFVLNGQILIDEQKTGEEVEEQEHLMFDEVVNFLKSKPAGLCSIDIKEFHQSMQIDAPLGWVFILLEWSDFD